MTALGRGVERAGSVLGKAVSPGSSVRRPLGDVRRGCIRAYRRATASERMLPTCVIIGAQKGGTSSLYEYLVQHPDVGRPALKEIQSFTDHAWQPLGWYRAHFPRAVQAIQACEATPYYLFHPACPERIRAALPDVKLIVLLRDPVERAYSHYHMNHAVLGYEKLDFASALDREEQRLAGEEEHLVSDPRYRSFAHKHFSYLARGMYAHQLERWYDHFPREQLLVAASEDLFADPEATLHRIQEWLGLSRHTPPVLKPFNAGRYAALDVALRADLRARFEPDIARLHELTASVFPWVPVEAGATRRVRES